MYFTKMSEEYFSAVIDLEKQSFPEEMRMGIERGSNAAGVFLLFSSRFF